MSNVLWSYVWLAYAGLFVLGFSDNLRGPFFAEIIESFQLSDTLASLIFAIPSFFAFVGSRWAQNIIQIMGSLGALRLGVIFLSFGFCGLALSFSTLWLYLFCAIFGLGLGVTSVSSHVLIQEGVKSSLRRRIFAGLHSMYSLASLLAPTVSSLVFFLGGGWRWGFATVGGVGSLVLAGSFLIKKSKSSNVKSAEHLSKPDSEPDQTKVLYLYSLFVSFYLIGELILTSRMVLYLRRDYHLSATEAPFYLSAFFLLLFVGRLLFTFFSWQKFSNAKLITAGLILSSITMFLGLFIHPVFLSITGFFLAPLMAIAMEYISENFSSFWAAKGVSLSFAVSALFVVAMHFSVGVLTDEWGLRQALLVGPFSHLVALFVFLCFHLKVLPKSKVKSLNSSFIEAQ
ncbi:MAG: MFS transporter [Bdellovibrio sp.]|nr:MAG: MFS transporter [Bdellovibrio sp.]